MTTIKLDCCNGGFGPIEHFYHEYLTISEKGVQFSRRWDISLEENKKERRFMEERFFDLDGTPISDMPEPPTDFSWRCEPPMPALDRCSNAIAEILFSIFISPDFDASHQVADGDSMEVELLGSDGKPWKNDVCWCGLPDKYRKAMAKKLRKILPSGIQVPPFLGR